MGRYIAANETVLFEQESIWYGTTWLPLSTAAHEYDEQQRLVKTTRGNGRVSAKSRMCCGILSKTDEDGVTQQTVTTSYSPEGRIATAGFLHNGEEQRFTYSYLPGSGLLQQLAMPNGVTLTQDYEPRRDFLTAMSYRKDSATLTFRSYRYDYNNNANGKFPSRPPVGRVADCDLTSECAPALWHILWDPTQPVVTRPLSIPEPVDRNKVTPPQVRASYYTKIFDIYAFRCPCDFSNIASIRYN